MKKLFQHKIFKIIWYFILVVIILEIVFLVFAKPILKKGVQKSFYVLSDSTYNIEFEKIKINLITGKALLVNFDLIPDIDYYYTKKEKLTKNFYEIHLDTLQLNRVRLFSLINKKNTLKMSKIAFIRPQFTVLGADKNDTTEILKRKSVSYDTIKKDLVKSIFKVYKNIKIKKFIIIDGNFDFLKPDIDNQNSFNIERVTFIINDFNANAEIFNGSSKEFFSDDIEMIIDGYQLKLSDNIHVFGAKKLIVKSKEKVITMSDIFLRPDGKTKKYLEIDSNIYNFSITKIKFENSNFKEIYLNHALHLSKAIVDGLVINIYSQKQKEKVNFNKDSLKSKVDIYHLFKDYLDIIHIDTVDVVNGVFNQFSNIQQTIPQTSIANFNLSVKNFLIDSASIKDINRVLYSKGMSMNMYGFRTLMKDSIHTLSAQSVVVSMEKQGIFARGIKIKPDNSLRLYSKRNQGSFNNFSISSINIGGFNFKKYAHKDEIDVQQILISNSRIGIKKFGKSKKSKPTEPFLQLFKNFATNVYIDKIIIPSGIVSYRIESENKNTYFTGKYKATINKFSFNPYFEKITKIAKVQSVNAVFTELIFNTSDSIYSIHADSLYYSSNKSKLQFRNLKFFPLKTGLIKRLQKFNKSVTFSIEIPRFTISNTNLSSAFENDSLSLKTVYLNNPSFELNVYPDIQLKNIKKKITNNIKRRAISKIIRYSTNAEVKVYSQTNQLDSVTYSFFKQKRNAIDTIASNATKALISLKISPNNIRQNDTTIEIISKITEIAILNIDKIAQDSLTVSNLKSALSNALSQIKFLVNTFNTPKIDKEELFHLIGKFLPKINSDTLIIKNGLFKYNTNNNESKKRVFQTNFDLRLYNFDFDTNCIDSTKRVLFSDNFIVSIRNSVFNLKDSIHRIKVNKFIINSKDSSVTVKKLKIFPISKNQKKIQMNVDFSKVEIKGIDYRELYFFHNVMIKNIILKNPITKLVLPAEKEQKAQKIPISKFFLPDKIKKVEIKNIKTQNSKFTVEKQNTDMKLQGFIDVFLFNFLIDSVTSIQDNKYFLPIENFELNAQKVNFLSPDSLLTVDFKKFFVASNNGIIKIDSLEFSDYNGKDSDFFDSVKVKNRMNVFINNIETNQFDFSKLRFKQKIDFKTMEINSPVLTMSNYSLKKSEKFDLNNINVYDKIKDNIGSIQGGELALKMVTIKLFSYSDTNIEKKVFRDINLGFKGIRIDSTTLIDRPNLFYCEDFIFDINNIDLLSKNGVYKIQLEKLSGSSHKNLLEGKNFSYFPIVPLERVQDYYEWRTTAMAFDIASFKLKSFDYYRAIFKQRITARLVNIDTMELITFTDRNSPHNYNQIKSHLIEPIFDFPFLVDIKMALLENVNIYYTEIAPVSNQIAKIKLGNSSIKLINITNDTAKISEKDIYTIIKSHGYLNDSAEIAFNVYYQLKSRGNFAKVQGEIGECNASIFNSYTINGVNLLLEKGRFHRIAFDFKINDTLAIGKMNMEYNDLKAYLVSKDTTQVKKMKLLSWLADFLLVRNDNPKYGIYPKLGSIAYIHDRTFSDIKMWIKALLSGVQSTIAFDPKDAKKIRKIMRKNKNKVEQINK